VTLSSSYALGKSLNAKESYSLQEGASGSAGGTAYFAPNYGKQAVCALL
jgi:hypothetical protein